MLTIPPVSVVVVVVGAFSMIVKTLLMVRLQL